MRFLIFLLMLVYQTTLAKHEIFEQAHRYPSIHARNQVDENRNPIYVPEVFKKYEHSKTKRAVEEGEEILKQDDLLHQSAHGNIHARHVAMIRAKQTIKNFEYIRDEVARKNGFTEEGDLKREKIELNQINRGLSRDLDVVVSRSSSPPHTIAHHRGKVV